MSVIFVDIDETICEYETYTRDYSKAIPIMNNIGRINDLYDRGHTIVYWTARGSGTGIDWTDETYDQLKKWGAKFTEVRLGKPYYDLFIDDKAINTSQFFLKEPYEPDLD